MEDQTLTIGIDLHYFMDNDQRHEMDASIHNKRGIVLLSIPRTEALALPI